MQDHDLLERTAKAASTELARLIDREIEKRIGPGPHDPASLAQRVISVQHASYPERTVYCLDQEPILETFWSGNRLQMRAIGT